LYRKLAKELLRSLSTQNAISNAEQMLESILNDVLFEDVALPTSARELIFKLMSNYLSNMNSLAIKSTIRGGAFVYNPSHNIVTVYDNAAGQVMTREDILYEINKLYKKKDTELDDFHSALKEELLKAENENEGTLDSIRYNSDSRTFYSSSENSLEGLQYSFNGIDWKDYTSNIDKALIDNTDNIHIRFKETAAYKRSSVRTFSFITITS
jgi:hypothetical protein